MDSYFRDMFCGVDDSVVLDWEQIEIIKNCADNLMVVAGAGSGKTTTISAKVNYLVDKLGYRDDEILVISFTNKAVLELSSRINNDFHHCVNVCTFHKLGYEIIKSSVRPIPSVIHDASKIIGGYIEKEIINDKEKLGSFVRFFSCYFDVDSSVRFFKGFDEYWLFKNRLKYFTLRDKIDYVNGGICVFSHEEQLIADYLFVNGINYKYREPYNKKYVPDFTIYDGDRWVFVEFFNFSKFSSFKYLKKINKIRKIHRNNCLIEVYSDDIISYLDDGLSRFGIKGSNKNINCVFDNIVLNKKSSVYVRFIDFCKSFISLFKSSGYSDFDFLAKGSKRDVLFFDFMSGLYDYYVSYLNNNNLIDFDDMINLAVRVVNDGNVCLKYRYIIIDEYQDISNNRFNLVMALKRRFNNKIMVVGDDWQCIYKFTSSNIDLFTNFKRYVGVCDVLKITRTYRNSVQLINVAGSFVMKDDFLIKKNLVSLKSLNFPITILRYKVNKLVNKLVMAIDYLRFKYCNKSILILGRYSFDINKFIDNDFFRISGGKVLYKKDDSINIQFMTVHASKGLGFDNVIIVNVLDDILGFPSKIKNDSIIDRLLPRDEVLFAEERRLFYVALTRTKNEVIILAQTGRESIFVKEIMKNKYVRCCNNLK